MDRLTSMGVFVTVVDLGSFAAAADRLGLSAPMVGKHVQFLENRLGVSLINRTTRRHAVTEIGRSFYDRCRSLLADAEAADALAAEHRGEPAGRLRIAAPVHFGRHCVMPVLLDLAQAYPALSLEFAFSDRLTDIVEEGYDLAIRTGSTPQGAGLTTRRIARQTMIVCAAPSYLDQFGLPSDIGDLDRHVALSYRRSGPAAPWRLPVAEGVQEWAPAGRFAFDDLAAIADACEAGLGIGWLPSWLVREPLRRGALRQVLTQYPGFPYDVHGVWPESRHLPVKVRHAIDAMVTHLPAAMGGAL
jgi:DNA-binding transcriptional LysR family regulator